MSRTLVRFSYLKVDFVESEIETPGLSKLQKLLMASNLCVSILMGQNNQEGMLMQGCILCCLSQKCARICDWNGG